MNYLSQWPELTLMKPDGGSVKAADVLSKPAYLMLYIGASWVEDCAKVTPLVIDFFRRQHAEKDFAVLYISRDTTEVDAVKDFMSHAKIASPPPPPPPATSPLSSPTSQQSGAVRRLSGSRRTSQSTDKAVQADLPDNFLVSTDGYYGLPFSWMERIAVPLVHQLRVFTYPAVLIVDNTAPIPPPLAPEKITAPHATTASAATSEINKPSKAAPSSSSSSPSKPSPQSQSLTSPRIERRECIPRVLSITGRFMLEVLDPPGENFPWINLSDRMAVGRRVFLTFALVSAAVIVLCIAYLYPAFVTGGPHEEEKRQARRLKRERQAQPRM